MRAEAKAGRRMEAKTSNATHGDGVTVEGGAAASRGGGRRRTAAASGMRPK